ncbi:MAG: hypothetical protein WDN46_22670 [Methylocella sp.]
MKIVTLSFAAAVTVTSFGIAEANQLRPDHSAAGAWAQGNVGGGRSVGVIGQGSLYDMDRPRSFGPARGPFEIY